MQQASGIFSWPASERRTDRYGRIGLRTENYEQTIERPLVLDEAAITALAGKVVHISAEVVEARDSGHIGDLMRGIAPHTPSEGTIFDLGCGTFFTEIAEMDTGPWFTFGLQPPSKREIDWFDPHVLYQLHDQSVVLTFRIVNG